MNFGSSKEYVLMANKIQILLSNYYSLTQMLPVCLWQSIWHTGRDPSAPYCMMVSGGSDYGIVDDSPTGLPSQESVMLMSVFVFP